MSARFGRNQRRRMREDLAESQHWRKFYFEQWQDAERNLKALPGHVVGGDQAGQMVERVARKLCALNGCDPDALAPDYMHNKGRVQAGNPPRQWEDYADDARTAIEEMREPTEDMKRHMTGMAYEAIRMEEKWPELFHRAWTAMVDVALDPELTR